MANQMLFLDPSLTDKEKLLSTIEHIPNILQVLDQVAEWYGPSLHLCTLPPNPSD